MTQEIDKIKKESDIFFKAKLIASFLKEKNFRIIDLAKELQLTSSYICHLLRLNKLPEIIESQQVTDI